MYTQLLRAALRQKRWAAGEAGDEQIALDDVKRCRSELVEGVPSGMEPDAVPVVLARQVGYDVALLRLAELVGIDTDPSRFDQPGKERARLERSFADLGIPLDTAFREAPGWPAD